MRLFHQRPHFLFHIIRKMVHAPARVPHGKSRVKMHHAVRLRNRAIRRLSQFRRHAAFIEHLHRPHVERVRPRAAAQIPHLGQLAQNVLHFDERAPRAHHDLEPRVLGLADGLPCRGRNGIVRRKERPIHIQRRQTNCHSKTSLFVKKPTFFLAPYFISIRSVNQHMEIHNFFFF